jgi:uncharacterized protein YidB (DUF937 family)
MGLLDNLESQAVNSLLGNSTNPLASGLLHMIQNQPGGLQGLVQSFHEKGMGGLVSAWVSTGPNPPATADQIQNVLGSDKVKQLAAAAGISPDVAGSSIAQLLPTIVDKLTPNGQIPEEGSFMDIAKGVLSSLATPKAS